MAVRYSMAAEYIAMDAAVREALFLIKMLPQMCISPKLSIKFDTDRDNAVTIMKKSLLCNEYEVCWYTLLLRQARGARGQHQISIDQKCRQRGDAFTKQSCREKFELIRTKLMTRN